RYKAAHVPASHLTASPSPQLPRFRRPPPLRVPRFQTGYGVARGLASHPFYQNRTPLPATDALERASDGRTLIPQPVQSPEPENALSLEGSFPVQVSFKFRLPCSNNGFRYSCART